jgi:hypothetical protein
MSLTNEQWDAIYARMSNGAATYEDAADLYFNSQVGAYGVAHGVTRELFMQRLQEKCPTPESLAALMRSYAAQVGALYAAGKQGRTNTTNH